MRQRPVSILCLLALFCLLAACSPKQDKKQEFMDHWKQLSQDSQGYSPAPSDLRPEPRVIMRHTEKQEQAASRPLPTIPVTLKLHNVDVGVALRSLAAAAGVNVMLSPGVSGTVSLNVQKSPWRDVFQGLLRANGLQYRWQGNILQVLTAVEKQKEINLQTLDNQLAQQELISRQNSPLTVSVVSVRYAEAAALQQSLTKFLTAANGQGGQAAVIEVDEHSNALIIQATEQDQQRIIRLVDNLDRPRPQVHLKAYIVEATRNRPRTRRAVGRRLAFRFLQQRQPRVDRLRRVRHAGDPVTGGLTGTHGSGLGGAPFGLDYSGIASNDMGSLGFLFGKVGGSMLEVQLNLMEKDGNINILSSPSITTLDNKMAYTENGEKVPYVSTSNMGDREVKFEDAVLRLEMTPNVIDGDNLKLKVLVKKDEVDTSRSVDGNPFIIKKQTETTLIMRNGETVVISGLTKEKGTDINAGVPGLKDIPGGKYVFGHESKGKTMEEVLIFITPEILPTRELPPLPSAPSMSESPSLRNGALPAPSAGAARR
ncbi:MAG: secretin N-terminal domain-containing protein [Bilophila wadsworthia]